MLFLILQILLIADYAVGLLMFNRFIQPKMQPAMPRIPILKGILVILGIEVVFTICIFLTWGLSAEFPSNADNWIQSLSTAVRFMNGIGQVDYPDGFENPDIAGAYILGLVLTVFVLLLSVGLPVLWDIFSPDKLRERMITPTLNWHPYSRKIINYISFLTIFGSVLFYFMEGDNFHIGTKMVSKFLISFYSSVQGGLTLGTFNFDFLHYSAITGLFFLLVSILGVGFVSPFGNLLSVFWIRGKQKVLYGLAYMFCTILSLVLIYPIICFYPSISDIVWVSSWLILTKSIRYAYLYFVFRD